MNRVLVGIVIIVLVIVGLVAGAAVLGLAGPMSGNMSGQWYYQGEKVGSPFAFIGNGEPIDELHMTVSWTATASGADPDSFSLLGTIGVYLVTSSAETILAVETFSASGASGMQGSVTKIFNIVAALSNHLDMKNTGWDLRIKGALSGTIKDAHTSDERTATWNGVTNYHVSWSDGSFTLTGSVGV